MVKFTDILKQMEEDSDQQLLDHLFDSMDSVISEKKDPLTDPTQPWGDLPPTIKNDLRSDNSDIRGKAIDLVKHIYDTAMDFVKSCKGAFNRMMQLEGQGGKVLISVKSLDSFLSKTLSRGKSPAEVHDVLRGAILLQTNEEVEKVAKTINKRYRVLEYDHKESPSNEYGYFGSHHFKILVNGSGGKSMIAELQLMTKKLWAYKKVAHGIYDKYREPRDVDTEIKAQDLALSRQLFQLGNR